MFTGKDGRSSSRHRRVSLELERLEDRLLLSSNGLNSAEALVAAATNGPNSGSAAAAASAPILCAATGHYYELVAAPGISWQNAKSAAALLSFQGVQGHLATITSQAESDFIAAQIAPIYQYRIWIGGYQPAGSSEPAGGWRWVTGEPWGFTNWTPPGPDNYGGNEDRIDLYEFTGGKWNDENGKVSYVDEYLVEFDTAVVGNTVHLGKGGAKSVKYSDGDGTSVTLKLGGGGSAIVTFAGANVQGKETKQGVILTGDGIAIDEIALQDTGWHTSLSFNVRGGADGLTTVNSITGSTPLGNLSAKGVDLVGAGVAMTGDGAISRITLHDLKSDADIKMPGAGAKTGVRIQTNNLGPGTDVILGSGLKSLIAASWGASNFEAPWASSLRIEGDFAADMTLTAIDPKGYSLGRLNVKGTMTDANITLAGGGEAITAARWSGGSLNADYLKLLRLIGKKEAWLSGDLANAEINLTGGDRQGYSLEDVQIAGRFDHSAVIASHSVRSFEIGHLGAGSILAVAVEPGPNGYFDIDAVGAGGRLNSLVIGSHDTDNGGVPFGIVADDFGTIAVDGNRRVRERDLPLEDGDAHIWRV